MKRVLTVIVTFNGVKWVDKCIGSVRESSVPSDIFVVDNGSTDGTIEALRGLAGEDLTLVQSKENLGFGKANNMGMEHALRFGYDFVYLLNQDAWIFPQTYSKLIEAFGSDSRIGIASPMQMTSDSSRMDSQFQKQCASHIEASKSDVVTVPFVMAAHWMISKECLQKVGGFSPSFHLYGEDDNFIDRCHYKGFTVAVHTKAIAVHDRDNRPRPKSYRMKIKKTHAVKMVSDPNSSPLVAGAVTPLWMVGMGIYHLSPEMISGAVTLIRNYGEIFRNRRESIKDGAFLAQ